MHKSSLRIATGLQTLVRHVSSCINGSEAGELCSRAASLERMVLVIVHLEGERLHVIVVWKLDKKWNGDGLSGK